MRVRQMIYIFEARIGQHYVYLSILVFFASYGILSLKHRILRLLNQEVPHLSACALKSK